MNKSLFVTNKPDNLRGYNYKGSCFDVADSSQLAFTMYLLSHTDDAPYSAVYVDNTVKESAFWKLKTRIHLYERKRAVGHVKLVREKPFSQLVKEMVPALFAN